MIFVKPYDAFNFIRVVRVHKKLVFSVNFTIKRRSIFEDLLFAVLTQRSEW